MQIDQIVCPDNLADKFGNRGQGIDPCGFPASGKKEGSIAWQQRTSMQMNIAGFARR